MKPYLAAEAIPGQVQYPKTGSPKYNGVRGLGIDGVLKARSLLDMPNRHTQKLFGHKHNDGNDGELIVGTWADDHLAPTCFNRSTSGVTSIEGEPDVRWYLFDLWNHPGVFQERIEVLAKKVQILDDPRIIAVEHRIIENDEQALAYMEYCVKLGLEGCVLRDPLAPYKFGRSTELEGGFLRLTPWLRSEAKILGIKEGTTNTNEPTKNLLGNTKRSSAKAGKVPTGRAGSLEVKDLVTGIEFSVSLNTEEEGDWFWSYRTEVLDLVIKYKFKQPTKIKPRFPQYEGFRAAIDMS